MPENYPEKSTFTFTIESGGPGDGDVCSFSESAGSNSCALSEEILKNRLAERENRDQVCQIKGDSLGDCTLSLTIHSNDFVDKKILHESKVQHEQNARWKWI